MTRKKLFIFTFLVLYLFSGVLLPAFAFRSEPSQKMPSQPRGKYATDLFTGSVGYSYPIKVPKGTDDLSPDVSLSYSSSATQDKLASTGMGWDLNRDYIERDSNYTPSNTGDDKFKLHFQGGHHDLVYMAGDGRYHTKIETQLHITKLNTGAANESNEYWQVITPDGTKYRFGQASNSELMCTGRPYVWRWYLDLVQDTHGNKIFYTYTENSGASYLGKIEYNTEKSRTVEFSYTHGLNYRPYYVQGCNVSSASKLNDIKVKANNNLINQFDLGYTQSGNTGQLLSTVTEKGSDGTALPPTTFTYNPQVKKWSNQAALWINNQNIDVNLGQQETSVVDVNGDGKADIVKTQTNGTWRVYLNTGASWNTTYQTWISGIDAHLQDSATRLIDVTGDSLPDIVRASGSDNWRVWKNTGAGWNSASEHWGIGAVHSSVNLTNPNVQLVDVTGDGLPDIVRSWWNGNRQYEVHRNTGSSWSGHPAEVWLYGSVQEDLGATNIRIVDVNGDNLADLVKTLHSGTISTWIVYINNGNGWNSMHETWVYEANIDVYLEKEDVTISDVNGDGLPDLIKSIDGYNYQDIWRVFLNTGYRWQTTPDIWINDTESVDANVFHNNVRLADVTGDGLTDIVKGQPNCPSCSFVTWLVWKNNGYAPDVLSSVKTPQGATISFEYSPSTKFDNTGSDSLSDLVFPLWVVTKKSENNGMTSTHQTHDVTTYEYSNGWYKWQEKEHRGFGAVYEYGPGNNETHYIYRQDDALKGKYREVQYRSAQGTPFAEKEENWSSTQTNGIFTPRLDSEKHYTYDGTVANLKLRQTDYLYDLYGNVTSKSEYGDTSVLGDERFTYYEYTTNVTSWILNTLKHSYQTTADEVTKVAESWFYYDGHTGLNDSPTKGNLTKEVKWLNGGTNPETTYAYDTFGNQTSVTNARGHTTATTYDTTGTYPTSMTNAKNQTTTMSYDFGTGNLLSKTDPNNQTTSYQYDVFGRILKEIVPYDTSEFPTTQYTYAFDGTAPEGTTVSKRETSGAAGTVDVTTYIDGFARKVQTRAEAENTSEHIVTDTFYDPIGEVAKETVPYHASGSAAFAPPVAGTKGTEITYDSLGRVTIVKNPQGDSRTTAYDHWKVTDIDENGHIKRKYLNAYEKIAKVEEVLSFLNIPTTYTYDSRDLLTKIVDASGNDFLFNYDSLGRKTSQVDPDMGTWTYGYDTVGNLTSQKDNRDITITKTYDELNRLTKTDYPTDVDITYAYDGNGKLGTLTSVIDKAGTVNYTYDNRLRKIEESRTVDGTTKTTQFSYDASDRQVSQTNPDGEVITNTFNTQGEIESVSNLLSNIDYNAFGKITKKDYANGLSTNYSYNADDFRLGRIHTASNAASPTTLQDMQYTYDNVGNVTSIANAVTNKTQTFAYDDLDRLVTASESGGFNYEYKYNTIGNLTKFTDHANGSVTDYTYGANAGPHAMTSSLQTQVAPTATPTATLTPTPTTPAPTPAFDLQDKTSANNDLTNNNGATSVSTDLPFVSSQYAVNLSGSGQSLSVPNNTTAWQQTGNFTIEFWFKTSTDEQYLAQAGGYDGKTSGWFVYMTGGKPRFYSGRHTGTTLGVDYQYVDTTNSLNDGNWHHVAYTYDGSNLRSYVDGNMDKTVAWSHAAGYMATNYGVIGARNLTGTIEYTFVGKLDDFRIWSTVRTGPQINSYRTVELGGNESGLAAYYPFETAESGSTPTVTPTATPSATVTPTPSGPTPTPEPPATPSASFTYDANGNMVSDGVKCMQYNEANQLDKVKNCGSNQTIAEYVYDYNGNRMVKRNFSAGVLANTVTSWSDSYETKVIVGGATENTTYYHVNGQLVGKKDKDGNRTFVHSDHLGSTSVVTDAVGGVVEQTAYDPWGQIKSGGTKSKFLYTGQEHDGETGLHYYNARYYDPEIRRFAQPDPWVQDIYNPQSLNRYSYVLNNPLRYTDPTGYWSFSGIFNSVAKAVSSFVNKAVNTVAKILAPKPPVPYIDPKKIQQTNIRPINTPIGNSSSTHASSATISTPSTSNVSSQGQTSGVATSMNKNTTTISSKTSASTSMPNWNVDIGASTGLIGPWGAGVGVQANTLGFSPYTMTGYVSPLKGVTALFSPNAIDGNAKTINISGNAIVSGNASFPQEMINDHYFDFSKIDGAGGFGFPVGLSITHNENLGFYTWSDSLLWALSD